jgi:hypothetical protein
MGAPEGGHNNMQLMVVQILNYNARWTAAHHIDASRVTELSSLDCCKITAPAYARRDMDLSWQLLGFLAVGWDPVHICFLMEFDHHPPPALSSPIESG